MKGWARGIILSKLAFSDRRQPASATNASVRKAHSTSTARLWLNTSRSMKEPDAWSMVSRARSSAMSAEAVAACMVYPKDVGCAALLRTGTLVRSKAAHPTNATKARSGQRQGLQLDAAGAGHQHGGAGGQEGSGRQRPVQQQRLEAGAVVAACKQLSGLACQQDPALGIDRTGRQARRNAGDQLLPGGARIGAAH